MLLTLLVFLFTHGKCSSTKEKSPHIIFILADDMVYIVYNFSKGISLINFLFL